MQAHKNAPRSLHLGVGGEQEGRVPAPPPQAASRRARKPSEGFAQQSGRTPPSPGERQGVEDDATPPLRAAGAVCGLRDTGQGTHVTGTDQHGFQTRRAEGSP